MCLMCGIKCIKGTTEPAVADGVCGNEFAGNEAISGN
jgi:hypothetical protein